MNTYVILRRSGWSSAEELQEAGKRSKQVADEQMPDDIRWIRSYVMEDPDGLGTVCVYETSSPEAIREHASRAKLPPATRSFRSRTPSLSDPTRRRPEPTNAN